MARSRYHRINSFHFIDLESAIAIESSLQNKIGESANLYAEVYGCDRELQELTNLDLEEWPKE